MKWNLDCSLKPPIHWDSSMKATRRKTTVRVEEIDALLGGEAQRLSDQYREVPLDFMDGYGWALTQICRLFHDATPVIKCKDCAKCGTDDCAMRFEDDDKVYQWNCADDFCSWAERKEE